MTALDAPFVSDAFSWAEAVATRPAVGLDDIESVSLLGRFDQKYLVRLDRLPDLIEVLGDVAVLEVDGSRCIDYTSVYFDSAELHSYRAHRQGRRRRYKVRTRHYGDPSATMLEVKLKGDRGRTVKHRQAHGAGSPGALDQAGRGFVEATIRAAYGSMQIPPLRPTLVTKYTRTTLVDMAAGVRLTVDRGLRVRTESECARFGRHYAIVESKSAERRPAAHRQLLRVSARPQRLSKYCLGVGALVSDLACNPWQHQLRQLVAGLGGTTEALHSRWPPATEN